MFKPIFKSDPRAAERRVYFDALTLADMKTPLADASLGTWVVKISKNGADAGDPSVTSVVEVDATDALGVWYVQLAAADVDTVGTVVVIVSNTDGSVVMATRRIGVEIREAHLFTVTSATSTSVVCNHVKSTANFWQNALVVPVTGTAVGQVAKVATSSTGTLGLDAEATFALPPSNGDIIELVVR